ncbi:MAG: TerB family tellurite resistance protein [Gammaproteobacteria bacterium]|nr:TerB family tellurite resistance protein [Gammaproteobacteria bacterium]
MIKNLKSYLNNFFQESPDKNIPHKNKIELATAVLMIEISLADENTGDEEYKTIKKILLEKSDLDETKIDTLISLAEDEVDHTVSLHEFAETINNELSAVEKTNIIENLWRVAYADAYIHKYEEYYIRKIADLLHVSHSDYIKTKLKTEK